MTIVVLTALLVADMYSYKFSWGSRATRVGGVVRYFFNSLKVSCASWVNWNLSYFLRSLKKWSPLTPSHEINLLKASMHPVNLRMSWKLLGSLILVIAGTFYGLGSIPWRNTIYPINFPEGMSHVHFLGFSFILNFLKLLKVSARSEMSPSSSQVFTTMSSTYTSALRPSCECRHHCIPRW
jgi:hypothetical protein